MEDLKIEKGKTYTYKEIKRIYKNAVMRTVENPTKGEHTDDAKFQISMMLSGLVILHVMEDNMFAEEEKEDE